MKKPLFTGVATALVTPFENHNLNLSMLEKLLLRQYNAGINTIVLGGTTGESPTLTDDEKETLFRISKKVVGSKQILIGGTGSNCTSHAIDLSVMAQEVGMDGLLVVTPYYNKATAKGLIKHFAAIADAVSIPVILYNVPSRTGVNIPIPVYRELSGHPNIIGVKEASGNMEIVLKIKSVCPPDFYIWSGNDDLTVPIMAMGGKGVISVASNVVPDKMQEMTDAALRGVFSTAAKHQMNLLPLIWSLFSEVNPIPVKEAMRIIGFDCGNCRLPLCNMEEENRIGLEKLLKK